MSNKHNQIRAKMHFTKRSILENVSLILEKMLAKIKDKFRFIKQDFYLTRLTIKEILVKITFIVIVCIFGNLVLNNIKFAKDISKSLTFCIDNYGQYLLACLGVGGFLIALFLSNVSDVITAKYTNIVSKVSVNILTEYTNRKYFQSMINYMCLIIILLFCWIFKIEINAIIAIISIFLTIRIIILYFLLAKRVYLFSDINMLTQAVYQEINVRFSFLESSIRREKKDSVFDLHGTKIMSLVETLQSLQKKIIEEKSIDDINRFSSYLMGVSIKYSEIKNLIPVDSKWFRIKYEPANWFEANSFEVNMRTQTGTSLDNKQIKNYYFLEDYINNLFLSIVDFLIEKNNEAELFKVIDIYRLSFDSILKNCSDFSYWNKFDEKVNERIISSQLEENEDYEAIVDLLSLNKVNIILNVKNYINTTFNDLFKEKKNNVGNFLLNEDKNNKLFRNNDIIDFIEKIRNEERIEKKVITSDSYIYEVLTLHFINNMGSLIDILDKNLDIACKQARNLSEKKYNLASCLLYSRIMEIEKKTLMVIDSIPNIYNVLLRNQFNFSFNKLLDKELADKINKNHYSILKEYGNVFIGIDNYDYNKIKIDFCGEIFYHFSESVFQTVISNDYKKFEKIYNNYTAMCFAADDFVYKNLDKNYNTNYLISIYKKPLLSFMDMNGCIIYHSHLVKDMRWEKIVKDTFNEIMNKRGKRKEIVKKMALIASVEKNSFDLNSFALNIKQRYNEYLNSNNILKTKACHSFYCEKEIDSDDELIKKFTYISANSYFDFYYDFYEVFVVYCINPLLDKKDKFETNLETRLEGDNNG